MHQNNKHINKLTLLLFSFILSSLSYAEIYKWVDDDGGVHFGDKKPDAGPAEEIKLEINTYTHVTFDTLDAADKSETPAIGKKPKVIMYSASWCGYCKKARKYFKKNRIAFTEYDVEKNEKARKKYKKLGATGFPVILVGKKRMNGFSEKGFERIYN